MLLTGKKHPQKQPPEVFCKKGVLKNSTNFTGKHLCWGLFLIKLQALGLKLFSCEICEIFRNTYFEKRLQMIASAPWNEISALTKSMNIGILVVDKSN